MDECTFTCPKCRKQFSESEDNSDWYDDDEYEDGSHLWDVSLTCPYCGHGFWEEVVI